MALTSELAFDARLCAIRYATPDVSFFEFHPQTKIEWPMPEAGAHIDIAFGDGMVRQYSLITPLCGPKRIVVAVRREHDGRGGSRRLHDESRVGHMFRLSAPRNHFPLNAQDEAGRVLLLAGGIGITPIYSMFAQLAQQARHVELHYWCRSSDDALFRDELEGRAGVTLHYSRGPERNAATLGAVLEGVDDDIDIYCCGPARMLDDFARLTAHRPEARNHVERFAAASMPLEHTGEFVVQLKRAGVEIAVGENETVLEALLREDIDVPYSCEEGICGACETKVLDGEPLHGDSIRSPEEHARRGTVMICCARSRSARLVLDL